MQAAVLVLVTVTLLVVTIQLTSAQRCSDSQPCPPTLDCMEGWCGCEDKVYSFYGRDQLGSEEYERCYRRAGATCVLNPLDPAYKPCVTSSFCDRLNTTHGRCQCDSGFVESDFGFCHGDYGTNCEPTVSSYQMEPICSQRMLLDCRGGQCVCASPTLEYESGRGCGAPVDEPCGMRVASELLNADSWHTVQCAGRLECAQRGYGKWRCEDWFGKKSRNNYITET